jgi:predicted dehydrogenase
VEAAVAEAGGGRLTVGFNRRFAPATRQLCAELSRRSGPLQLHVRVDAGALEAGHWLLDPAEGGGRLLGEVCHFVDLAAFLCGERIRRVFCAGMAAERDSVAITLEMSGGSLATIQYVAHGEAGRSKEMVEIFGRGTALRLEGFRRGGKGHAEAVRAFLDAAAAGQPSPVPEAESFHVTRVLFAIAESLRDGEPVSCADG